MPGTRGPVPVPLQDGNRDLTLDILETLDTTESLQTQESFQNVPQPEIKAALDRLASRQMVEYTTNDTEQVVLTEDGDKIVQEGSHEYKVWEAVQQKGRISLKDLPVCTLDLSYARAQVDG